MVSLLATNVFFWLKAGNVVSAARARVRIIFFTFFIVGFIFNVKAFSLLFHIMIFLSLFVSSRHYLLDELPLRLELPPLKPPPRLELPLLKPPPRLELPKLPLRLELPKLLLRLEERLLLVRLELPKLLLRLLENVELLRDEVA